MRAKICMFLLCVAGVLFCGSDVNAEEEVRVVREASGDMEPLMAVYIPEEELGEWETAESSRMAGGRADADTEKFLSCGSDYGYKDMAKRTNGAGRQDLYRKMDEFCRNYTVNGANATQKNGYYIAGSVKTAAGNMTLDELAETYFMFRNDNPQYFWLANLVAFSQNTILIMPYDVYWTGAARTAALTEIIGTSKSVYQSRISGDDSRYQKVLKIHDALIADVEYAWDDFFEETWETIGISHSIAGAMTSEKSAVCEGYAKVMQLMLNYYDISNIYVTGIAGGGHAWNMVRMNDGKYYWLDATWDDQEQEVFWHQYFLVGNLNITDHVPNSPSGTGGDFLYELPKASDTDYVYDPGVTFTKGNINDDEDINITDLMMCLYHVSGRDILEGNAFKAADIDGNGKVELTDLMRLLYFVSGRNGEL